MRFDGARWRGAAVFAAIVMLALLGYGQLLVPGRIPYSPHSDVVAYHLAAKHVLHRSMQAGHGLPYWRADQLSGTSAFTSPNALYTNPLHVLYQVWEPARATGPTVLLTLLVGALAFYLVAASLRLGWPARLFVALAGLFNFKMILAVYAGWLAPLCGIVSFPLLFAAAFALVKTPGLGPTLALSASGALCLHSGQLQFVYYAGWFLLAFLLMAWLGYWRSGQRQQARRLAGHTVAGALLALAMSLYLVLPMLAEAGLVSRSQATHAFLQSAHTLGFRHLLTLVQPEVLGTPLDGSYPAVELWEDVAYFGIVPLVLAGVGVGLGWRRSPTRFLAAGFVLSTALALDSPVIRAAQAVVPGMRLFRLPGRFLFLTAFFGIVLAGIGFDVLWTRWHSRRLARWGLAMAISILAGEGVFHAHRYVRTESAALVEPRTEYAQAIASAAGPFRCAPVGRSALAYGAAAGQGLQLVTGYEPYNLGRYQDYLAIMATGASRPRDAVVWTDIFQLRRWDLLDALNVKYVLSSWPLTLPEGRFRLVRRFARQPLFVFYEGIRQSDVWLYENTRGRPRAYFAEKLALVADPEAALRLVTQENLDTVTIVVDPERVGRTEPPAGEARAFVTSAADGILTIDTHSDSPRFLVLSEIWHPGWHAFVDGGEVPLRQTNGALLGAWVPAGAHRVGLIFRPLHLRIAVAISVLACAIFVGAMAAWAARLRAARGGRAGCGR